MLQRMEFKNLTVFPGADLHFGRHLNVIVGENGTGKTHLLKLAYSVLAMGAEEGRKPNASTPTKNIYQSRLAEKITNVFRPDHLGRLARRRQGKERCDISLSFEQNGWDIEFNFTSTSQSEVKISKLPSQWVDVAPVYLPSRELLTIYPNFVAVYEGHYLEFEETWRDTCLLLGALLQRGPKEQTIKRLLEPLEKAMGGTIDYDKNGRFYLKTEVGRMEMPLVAEGLRKLGMISRLIATGSLLDKGYLFWDEPEANLNPRLIKEVAKSILDLSATGIQVFIATHSLFLLRELDILRSKKEHSHLDAGYFGLHKSGQEILIEQGKTIDDAGDIAVLDEELEQSERYMSLES